MQSEKIIPIRDVDSVRSTVSPEEWEARVDLAACYRLVAREGWNNGIYNHVTLRAPGEPDRFLIKAHALLWDEVTASNLIKVDMNDELDERSLVNRPGFVLHSAVLRARPDVNAVVHIHPGVCIAVAAQPDGLLPIAAQSLRFWDRLAYHDYEGLTENADERERIIAHLGDKPAMLMRSHGATTLGRTVGEAFIMMGNLIEACEIQLRVQATGAGIVLPPPAVCEATARQIVSHEAGRGQDDWPARLRTLDRADPSFRE